MFTADVWRDRETLKDLKLYRLTNFSGCSEGPRLEAVTSMLVIAHNQMEAYDIVRKSYPTPGLDDMYYFNSTTTIKRTDARYLNGDDR
jgi:hypothetical protein